MFFLLFPSEKVQVWKKIKTDKKTLTSLFSLFEKKPENVEIFLYQDSIYVVKGDYKKYVEIFYLSPKELKKVCATSKGIIVPVENANVPFILGQTIVGLGIYSWAFPWFLLGEVEDYKIFTAMGLFTPLIWFGVAGGISKGNTISYGSAYGSFLGSIEGAFHGELIFDSPRAVFPVSLTENLLALYLGQKYLLSPAVFQRKFNHFIYGYYHYTMVKLLFTDEVFTDLDNRIASALSLTESYLSIALSKDVEYLSWGDALFELRTSLIGAELLPSILLTLENIKEDFEIPDEWYALSSLLGHGAGYYIGYELSKKYDISLATGLLSYLIPSLAHGFSAGLGILMESSEYWKFYPLIFIGGEIILTTYIYKAFSIRLPKETEEKRGVIIYPLLYAAKPENNFSHYFIKPGVGISLYFK